MTMPHTIAVVAELEERNSQAFLSMTAARWREAGEDVVGVLAEKSDINGPCSAGFLRDIASGRRYSIHLDTPPVGKTCHIDAVGMDDACTELLAQIASADVVILSKFGKLEAMRQGLWRAFSAAVATGKPLLTTVSSKHVEAWATFAPVAESLIADSQSVEQWWQAAKHKGPTQRHT